MPQVGFEPAIPVFELAKTVHALDCAATVIGTSVRINLEFISALDVSYVCLMLREENNLNAFDNRLRMPKGKKLQEERSCVMRRLITYRLTLHKYHYSDQLK
jgi:hypothetical protein